MEKLGYKSDGMVKKHYWTTTLKISFVKADRSMTQSLAIRLPHYCGPNRRSEPQGDLWHVFINLASSTTQSRLVLGCTRWGLSSSVPHTFHYFSKTKARKARALGGTTAVVNSTLLLADVMSGVDPVPQDPLPGPPPSVDQLRFKIHITIIKEIDLRDKKDFARV